MYFGPGIPDVFDPVDVPTTQLNELVLLAAEGDDHARQELIVAAAGRLQKLTRRMLYNYPRLRRWEQTDDIFQSAVFRLSESLSEVKPANVRAFFGLASTQIRRTLIDLARHHFGPAGAAGAHESREEMDQPNPVSAPGEPGTLAAWSRFHEAIGQLPDNEREVFGLLWYGGMTQQQVAEIVDVSLPTVQRRWYRARHLLFIAMERDSNSILD